MSIEIISVSANSHEIRTLVAPMVALRNIGRRKRLPTNLADAYDRAVFGRPLARSAAEDAYSAFRLCI